MRLLPLLTLMLVSLPCLAQQDSMPGDSMPGMEMPTQQKPQPAPMQMPRDMQSPTPGDAAAQKEAQSMHASQQQQKPQEAVKPGSGSDSQSLTADTFTLQEREAPEIVTGASAPAPALLNEVTRRPPLTLAMFLAIARRQNPTLAQAGAAVTRAQQQAKQAGLAPDPSIGYSGDHIRGGSYHGGEQGAFVQQNFVLGGKLGLRRNVYAQQAKEDAIGVTEQQYRVDSTVEQAFYRALTAQATVVIRQRMLKVALDAEQTAHQLSNVGQADAPDVLQSEVEAEQAQVDFVTAQHTFLSAFSELAADAGSFSMLAAPLEGDIEAPPQLDTAQQTATILENSPQLARARQAVAVAEAQLKSARREPVPDLKVKAGEWYSGEDLGSSSTKEAGPMSFAEAGIELPLWNRNQGNVGAAKIQVELAQAEVTRTHLVLTGEADMLAQNYLSSRFAAERYRTELLPRARRAYQLFVIKYQQMAQAYPQVLVSQRTLFELQAGYLQALGQQWEAAVALQNFTLSEGLAMPAMDGSSTTTLKLPGGAD